MDRSAHNKPISFIWIIADDCLRDVYLCSKEINDETYVICKSYMVIKGNNFENIRVGSMLSVESKKLDTGIASLQQPIQKLKECKTTIINSAVTGKIKVPGIA